MAEQPLTLPDNIVKKSNALARARWKPESIWEPRIVALVASKVHKDDEDFLTYKIPVAELAGVDDRNLDGPTYRKISHSIAHLGKAIIRIEGKGRNFRQYSIFAMCGYEDGYLIAGFHPDLKPHFLNLNEEFTQFSLFEYLALPSSYSQQLFELIKSWSKSKTGEFIISVAELHDLLNTPESFRANFKDFRRWVLVKAHKDIHAHTSLRYEYEELKKGRSYHSIRFYFRPERRASVEAEAKKKQVEKKATLETQRAQRALDCARGKQAECSSRDQRPIICKMCRKLDLAKPLP